MVQKVGAASSPKVFCRQKRKEKPGLVVKDLGKDEDDSKKTIRSSIQIHSLRFLQINCSIQIPSSNSFTFFLMVLPHFYLCIQNQRQPSFIVVDQYHLPSQRMLAPPSKKASVKLSTCIEFLGQILDLNINLIHLWTITNTAAITGKSLKPVVKSNCTAHCNKNGPPPFP